MHPVSNSISDDTACLVCLPWYLKYSSADSEMSNNSQHKQGDKPGERTTVISRKYLIVYSVNCVCRSWQLSPWLFRICCSVYDLWQGPGDERIHRVS